LAFERALTGGILDAHTRLWYEHAKRFVGAQDAGGPTAVLAEVEQALPTLLQPPLPFQRVDLPPSDPPPGSASDPESLVGTGERGSKRIRQKTLVGLAAISPGRDTMPSDEGEDDADPTKQMRSPRSAQPAPAPLQAAVDPSTTPEPPPVMPEAP